MAAKPHLRTADRILDAARPLLAEEPAASLDRIAAAAGVSRATLYRHFASRARLLDALDLEPDPDARARILQAAIELLDHESLRSLTMDEIAEQAGVSRATAYRLFPGKSALFAALLDEHAPFAEAGAALHRLQGEDPQTAIPQLLATLSGLVAPKIAILRSIMLEVSVGDPEAFEAAQTALSPLYAEVARYFGSEIAAGRIHPIEPILAAQSVVGPLLFNLLGQSLIGPVTGIAVAPAEAAAAFAQVALHGLLPTGHQSTE
jgi:AcrR family transcriptional regulator